MDGGTILIYLVGIESKLTKIEDSIMKAGEVIGSNEEEKSAKHLLESLIVLSKAKQELEYAVAYLEEASA